MNPNPNYEGECRFTSIGMSFTTCAYYPPVYDKHGNNTNPDRNVTSGKLSCLTCNKQWNYAEQFGETIFEEIVDAQVSR